MEQEIKGGMHDMSTFIEVLKKHAGRQFACILPSETIKIVEDQVYPIQIAGSMISVRLTRTRIIDGQSMFALDDIFRVLAHSGYLVSAE